MLVCTKKTIFLSFIILSLSFSLMAQRQISPIAREVGEVFQNTAHSLVAPFKPSVRDAGQDERTRQIVHRGTLLELDTAILNQVLSEGPPALRLVVPRADGAELVLDLVATDPYAEGFRVFAASRRDIPADIDRGRHYRGIISGKLETLAAVSFHKGEMRGVIGTGQGDLVIGKLGGVGNKKNYILYNDYDLKVLPNSVCAADSLPPLPQNRDYTRIIVYSLQP